MRLLTVISSDCLWGRDWGPEKEGQQLTFSLYILLFVFVIFYHEHVLPSQKNKFKIKTKQSTKALAQALRGRWPEWVQTALTPYTEVSSQPCPLHLSS